MSDIELRPEVQKFAEAMEMKLRENDHKGGWKNESVDYFEQRLLEEGRELAHVIKRFRDYPERVTDIDRSQLLKESADFMNYLMMLADVCGAI